MMKSPDEFSLRQVVELTGITEFTLRGWEARYQAFSPQRTPTGRRKYHSEDLQKAVLLRELLKRGHRIGEVASLNVRDLRRVLEDAGSVVIPASLVSVKTLQKCLTLTRLQNWGKLELLFWQLSRTRSPLRVLEEFALPLMQALSAEVEAGMITIAQEHILSAHLLRLLHGLRSHRPRPGGGTRLLIACPEGDHHALGISAVEAYAALHGRRSLYLGPNTPKNELCETALRYVGTHVVLGSTVAKSEGAKEDLHSYLHYLLRNLPKSTEIWVGGRNSSTLALGDGLKKIRLFVSLKQVGAAIAAL